jgi:hypothetical protein
MTDDDNDKRLKFYITNKVTKEKVEGYGLIVPSRAPHPYKQDGVQVNQIVLRDLAVNPHLSKRALRIAVWLLSDMRPPPVPQRSRKDIAHALQMNKSDVTKGLQELYALGQGYDEHGVYYRPILPPGLVPYVGVRPSVAWKGRSGDLVDAMAYERLQDQQVKKMRKVKVAPPPQDDKTDGERTDAAQESDAAAEEALATEAKPAAPKSRRSLRAEILVSQYPVQEVLTYVRKLEKTAEPVTIKALLKLYPKTRQPSETTMQRILNRLVRRKELSVQKGTGRTPAVYSSPVPPQDAPSRPVNKPAARRKASKEPTP